MSKTEGNFKLFDAT